MEKVKGLKCIACGEEYGLSTVQYVCKKCRGNLQVIYNYKIIKRNLSKQDLVRNANYSIWRYYDLLPVSDLSKKPPLQIGWTPFYKTGRLGKKLGLKNLYIKDDGRNPSASSKDRAGAVVIVHALEKGEKIITGASTGNAASSLSCLSASLGLKVALFIPVTAPRAKVAQLLVFGATVIAVDGTYDDAFDLCLRTTQEYGWYNRNTGYNPYTREGKKTVAYEICEQLSWKSPDKVFVSVGDGNLISGVWKGFRDLFNIGFIDKQPQLIASQAEKSDAVKRAFESDGIIRSVSGETIADSISVQVPRDGYAAVKAIRESKGSAISVTDDEILCAIPELAERTGVFAEPAGVVPYAALKKAVSGGMVGEDEVVVLLVSGGGLKDIDSALKSVAQPYKVQPDFDEVKKLFSNLNLDTSSE